VRREKKIFFVRSSKVNSADISPGEKKNFVAKKKFFEPNLKHFVSPG
jgi:hypothetical protein